MKNSVLTKQTMSVKRKTLLTLAAVAASVALPWLLHAAGHVLHIGTSVGEIFLPMHIFVMVAGFVLGPAYGAVAGIASPVLSFMITGMPTALMLPFMIVELCAYGFFAGAVRNMRFNSVLKVGAVQLLGRLVKAVAILTAIGFFNSPLQAKIIYTSIIMGLPGIALQLLIVPFIVKKINE